MHGAQKPECALSLSLRDPRISGAALNSAPACRIAERTFGTSADALRSNFCYIFSGAETPSNARPFFSTCASAKINASRASLTFSSSTRKREAL